MNERYYYPVVVDNLENIRRQLVEIFPKNLLSTQGVGFNQQLSDEILSLPDVQQMFEQFGGVSEFLCASYNVNQPNTIGGIHIDDSDFVYSFNIPIINYENTFLNIFHTISQPIESSYTDIHGSEINYFSYKLKDCELVEKIETTKPHVLNTSVPHQVVNPNPTIRVNILFRLALTASLKHLA